MLIREIMPRFRNLRIFVTIDPQLVSGLDCSDNFSNQRTISINLYKLIYAIGTIQTRRFAPSNRMKFLDKSDLIEKVFTNTNDFRIKISEIRITGGQEVLASISEDFGVGISVLIAENLFSIKYSTIQRIYGHTKRPDWKCQTNNNRILVVESKGASARNTSDRQVANALAQKASEVGDIKIASLTVLNEDEISTNRFLDPPISSDNMDTEMNNNVLRAGHYSSVFSFLGHSVLSKYYSQMRKRLLKSLSEGEQIEKDILYAKLRDDYLSIEFAGNLFTGSFYGLDDETFLFIGIDKNLLSYQGFIDFRDYEKEIDETSNQNHYVLFKDGILIIEIKQIEAFSDIITPEKIKNYQENITISDVDAMTESSFAKYVRYLLTENGIDTEYKEKDRFGPDIIGWINNKKYFFELKLYRKKKFNIEIVDRLIQHAKEEGAEKSVLITNAVIPDGLDYDESMIVLIGREELRKVLKRKKSLLEILYEDYA